MLWGKTVVMFMKDQPWNTEEWLKVSRLKAGTRGTMFCSPEQTALDDNELSATVISSHISIHLVEITQQKYLIQFLKQRCCLPLFKCDSMLYTSMNKVTKMIDVSCARARDACAPDRPTNSTRIFATWHISVIIVTYEQAINSSVICYIRTILQHAIYSYTH